MCTVGEKSMPIDLLLLLQETWRIDLPYQISSVSLPLIIFGRERVVPQQAGLFSDFISVLGQNTTPGTAESTRRNSGSIIAETNIDRYKMALQRRHSKHDKKFNWHGSFISFLSKTTVTKLTSIIKDLKKKEISNELKSAKMFSIEMDSPKDVSCNNQCSIVVWYAYGGRISERLLFLVQAKGSAAQSLFDLLKAKLEQLNIYIKFCIGDSSDGAAHISGQCNGLQQKSYLESSFRRHYLFYATAMSYCALLISVATFSESHLRE